jgi:L-fuculose-phosphate aldolase
MSRKELTELIIEIGKRLWLRKYVAANDGNISVRLNENEILTTPTGVSKGFLSEEMILLVDINGNLLERNSKYRPTSEFKMHAEVYKQRPDINAVVHSHPPFATSFALAGVPLDECYLPESALILGAVPIAHFALPSTNEVPESIRDLIKQTDVILLANHGALTAGKDLIDAYFKMETLEHTAEIVWRAKALGNINVLSEENKNRLFALRDVYSLKNKIIDCKGSKNKNGNN